MFTVRMHLNIPPSKRRWEMLSMLAELTAADNAEWYAYETSIGNKPPCSLACATPKIVYKAPKPGIDQNCQNFWTGPQAIARGKANCIDASAYDVGVARAYGREAHVYLEPVGMPTLPGDPYSTLDFHAWAVIDGVSVDSSANLSSPAGCDCG